MQSRYNILLVSNLKYERERERKEVGVGKN